MAKQIALFVHGLWGKPEKTWGRFPDLIRTDPDISNSWDPDFYGYPTPFFRIPFLTAAPNIQLLADGLGTELETKYPDHQTPIVLVCHSLGGLVARRYVADQFMRSGRCRVARLLLYGTPHDGSGLAKVAKHISWFQTQLRQLCRRSEFLNTLNKDWGALHLNEKFQTLCVVGGADDIVSEASAKGFWPPTCVRTVIDASHTGLVKPENTKDLRYLILKRFLMDDSPSSRDQADAAPAAKVETSAPQTNWLRFRDAFQPDAVSIKLAVDGFRSGGAPSVLWPVESSDLLDAVNKLRAEANNYHDPSSPFVPDPQLAHWFLKLLPDIDAIIKQRTSVEARIPYLLEELCHEETLRWREQAIAGFLAYANFWLHWPLALALMHVAVKPEARARRLAEPWHKLMLDTRCNRTAALAQVMAWPLPIYRQSVMELSGERLNQYFYVPEAYCHGPFSTTEAGFVRCIIPQYEMDLALSEPTKWIRYDGKVTSSKTVDESGDHVYPSTPGVT